MASPPHGNKRSGGPRTDAGKAAASRNAFKGGLTLDVLINEAERELYHELADQLWAEYAPRSATMKLLLHGLTMALVKRHRQDRVESALYEKAQVTAAHAAEQPAAYGFASHLPKTPEAQAHARQILVNAAMPEMQRVDVVMRYGTAVDRQITRLLEQIRRQHEADGELSPAPGPQQEPNGVDLPIGAAAEQRQNEAASGHGN